MKPFQNILLIRAGVSPANKFGHPVHRPAPLSLKYVEADLKKQEIYNVKIIDSWVTAVSRDDILRTIDQSAIDFIIMAIDSPASEAGYALCRFIKEHKNTFICAVGSDVTERHQAYLEHNFVFDVIIRGEYELEIGVLLNQLNTAGDRNAVIRYYNHEKSKERVLVDNLDDLPALYWDREEIERYPYIYPMRIARKMVAGYVSTSRGCPHGCTFCSPTVRKSYGRKLRIRSAANVAEDMEDLSRLGVNIISFEDDDFTLNKDHVQSVCREIQKKGLRVKWACHARIDEVTPELLKIMKAAGCILLLFGIESGSYKVIRTLQKLSSKVDWCERAVSASQSAREAGIAVCAMFIVGSPGESEPDIDESIRLAYAMDPDLIKVHFFTLYPGSVDYQNYREMHGEQSPYHYLEPIVNLSDMDNATLKKAQLRFYKKFLFRPSFLISHVFHYFLFYLSNWPRSWKLVRGVMRFLFSANQFKKTRFPEHTWTPKLEKV